MHHDLFAATFLLALVVLFCLAVLGKWRRTWFTPTQFLLHFLGTLLVRFLWGARLPSFPLAKGQGVVVVSNHRSSVDPFFLQICLPWAGHWMVAREYCEKPGFGWFLRQCEVIPTNRAGIDTAATKTAIRLASQGEVVGMLPEGRINMTEEFMLPGRPGAVLVAIKARVPILPAYIEGSPYNGKAWGPLLMKARVRVKLGKPIDLSPYYGREGEDGLVEELMLRCMHELAVLAGHPDFKPRLAGRRWKPSDDELRAHEAALLERKRKRTRSGRR